MGRARSIQLPLIQVEHPALNRLCESVRYRPLSSIHLGTRAINSLERVGVSSIGDLIDRARLGIVSLRGAGKRSIDEILEALHALSESVQADAGIEWIQYARRRNFLILPKRPLTKQLSPRRFLQMFPDVVGEAVKSRFSSAECLVLREYLLGGGRESRSLKQVGQKLGNTKQAVSLLKEKVVTTLKEAIFEDGYCGCRFRFRDAFVAPLRRLKRAIDAVRGTALPYSKWEEILTDSWGIAPVQVARSEGLILELVALQISHPSGKHHEPIVVPMSGKRPGFTAALQRAEQLLRVNFPGGLSKKQLFEKLCSEGWYVPNPEELAKLVATIPGVEAKSSSAKVRLAIEKLARMSDQLERILSDSGRPMRAKELAQQLSRFPGRKGSRRTSRHVGTAMSKDNRFTSIGCTGIWSLDVWGVETSTVADVVARILREVNRPLTEIELYPLITARRPVKFDSIMTLLREDGRFRRVAPRTWRLENLP